MSHHWTRIIRRLIDTDQCLLLIIAAHKHPALVKELKAVGASEKRNIRSAVAFAISFGAAYLVAPVRSRTNLVAK